jgi:hypothetical protein
MSEANTSQNDTKTFQVTAYGRVEDSSTGRIFTTSHSTPNIIDFANKTTRTLGLQEDRAGWYTLEKGRVVTLKSTKTEANWQDDRFIAGSAPTEHDTVTYPLRRPPGLKP